MLRALRTWETDRVVANGAQHHDPRRHYVRVALQRGSENFDGLSPPSGEVFRE